MGAARLLSIEERALRNEPDAGARHLRVVPLDDLDHAHIPPQNFAIEPLLPCRVVTLLGAHGGAGKSVLALTWAAHYAAGRSWNGLQTATGRVLFVSLEDSGDIVRQRLRRICADCGLSSSAVAENLVLLDGSASDGALATELLDVGGCRRMVPTAVWDELTDAVDGAGLVVIDNASDAFSGNENERRQVRAFMRMLAGVAREHDAAVLLLAHIDKHAARFGAGGNSYSGSTAWHNSARSRLALLTENDSVQLLHEKANLTQCAPPIALRWDDERGLLVPAGNQRPTLADAISAEQQAEAEILAALTAATALGVSVSASRTGPGNGHSVMLTIPETPAWARGRNGRDRYWAVIGRLMARGRIEVESYRTSARNVRERIVVREFVCALQSPTPPAWETHETNAAPRVGSGCVGSSTTNETHETNADAYRRAKDGEP